MKIRSGHVSNSSSSSFIVIFDGNPKDPKYLKERLFGNDEEYEYEYSDKPLSVDSMVNYVISGISENTPVMANLIRELESGYFDIPGFNEKRPSYNPYVQAEHDEYNKKFKDAAKKFLLNWIEKSSIEHICIISLADDDGSVGCACEHGNIFRGLKHLRISHH